MECTERRRGVWMASLPGEAKACDKSPTADQRRCNRCGQNCGKKGHKEADFYARRPPKGRSKRHGEIKEEMRKMCEQLEELGGEERGAGAMFVGAEEEDTQSHASFPLMAKPGARQEASRQWGDGLLRAGIAGRGYVREKRCAEDPEFEDKAFRHPKERMICHSMVLVATKGSVVVGGIPVDLAIIDTGSHHVLIGKGLVEQMQLHEEGRLRERGFSVMTAEGGEPKWLPCTWQTVEIVLKPRERDKCRVKLTCRVTQSEDYDLLMGIRLLYAIGATICTWQEKVIY
ncbi:unnamed protein product [Closterium sp. NIES-53]